MEFKSVQKYVMTSPKKLREVSSLVGKMKPAEAVAKLPFSTKMAAIPLIKVIKTAMAQAKEKGIAGDKLIFKEVQINEGPRHKRGRPVSRGQWHPYKKRMSHIRVVLQTVETEVSKSKTKKQERRDPPKPKVAVKRNGTKS